MMNANFVSEHIDPLRVFFAEDERELNDLHRAILSHAGRFDNGSIVAGFHVREDLDNFEIRGRPVMAGSVFVPHLNMDAPLSERLSWEGRFVHEVAHSNGANEVEARLAEREYLQQYGLKGPTENQILKEIAEKYSDGSSNEFVAAYQEFFGEEPSFKGWGAIKSLLRANRFRFRLTKPYSVDEDWRASVKAGTFRLPDLSME